MNDSVQKLIDKLIADGFDNTFDDKGISFYSRVTKIGAPKDSHNQSRVYFLVEVNKTDGTVNALVEAHNGDHWCRPMVSDVPADYFIRHLSTVEKRVVHAWRELCD